MEADSVKEARDPGASANEKRDPEASVDEGRDPEASVDEARVIFYRLTAKFVDNEQSIPAESQDVLYYTLSIGHHTGIIDCLSESFSCALSVFESFVELFDADDPARYKLEAINRFGEVQIDRAHLGLFADFDLLLKELEMSAAADDPLLELSAAFMNALVEMREQTGLYLMGRLSLP